MTENVTTERAVNPADAVLDTNGFLDMFSNRDLFREYEKPGFDLESREAVFRRARPRESILCACYFNQARATTFVLKDESLAQLEKLAPSKIASAETYHTTHVIHFVIEYVLPEWSSRMQMIGMTEGSSPKGNGADAALVECAKEKGLPLVTNEGFNKDGYDEGGIGKRSTAAGVRWFHPRKFYEGKIDEAEQIAAFLARFKVMAPEYLKTAPSGVDEVLQHMSGYFRHILLGETTRGRMPVRVTI